jgi:two-component system response regulator AtoC
VTKKADLRIIAATNHDLKTGIREKRFREDLYYRLNVIQFELPPLRERKEDIALLSRHFLAQYAAVNRKTVTDISPEAMQVLMGYEFPGNVRELENIMERGVIFCRGHSLSVADLQMESGRRRPALMSQMAEMPFREAKARHPVLPRPVHPPPARAVRRQHQPRGGPPGSSASTAPADQEAGIETNDFSP